MDSRSIRRNYHQDFDTASSEGDSEAHANRTTVAPSRSASSHSRRPQAPNRSATAPNRRRPTFGPHNPATLANRPPRGTIEAHEWAEEMNRNPVRFPSPPRDLYPSLNALDEFSTGPGPRDAVNASNNRGVSPPSSPRHIMALIEDDTDSPNWSRGGHGNGNAHSR